MSTIELGAIKFENIQINSKTLGEVLSTFISKGSYQGGISKNELTIVRRTGQAGQKFVTLAEALEEGTRLFDAIAYFSLPEEERPEVALVAPTAAAKDPTMKEIADATFYVYMWIMIRGTCPDIDPEQNTQPVPGILAKAFKLTKQPHEYVRTIATFNIAKLSLDWIKYISITNLSQPAQNRLALGVAGYRNVAALYRAKIRPDADETCKRAIDALIKWYNRGPVWSCHGATRSMEFSTTFKKFNKEIENLIAKCATKESIQQLVDQHYLFEKPKADDSLTGYQTWTDELFNKFSDYIFTNADLSQLRTE